MDNIKCERLMEVVFDLTIDCYERLQTKYEDSRYVLEIIRAWAHEFEDWWNSLTEDEQERRDYILSVDDFAERHLEELTRTHETRPYSYNAAGFDLRHGEYEGDQETSYV